jgi:hypothetical protein
MKIPTFVDLKRTVTTSTHGKATKRAGNSGSRLIWPLAAPEKADIRRSDRVAEGRDATEAGVPSSVS